MFVGSFVPRPFRGAAVLLVTALLAGCNTSGAPSSSLSSTEIVGSTTAQDAVATQLITFTPGTDRVGSIVDGAAPQAGPVTPQSPLQTPQALPQSPQLSVAPVPEPSPVLLWTIGIGGVGALSLRARRRVRRLG